MFRYSKGKQRGNRNLEEKRTIHEEVERSLFPEQVLENPEAAKLIDTWVRTCIACAIYLYNGGDKNLNENEVRKLDHDSLQPHPPLRHFRSVAELAAAAHRANWILIRGKHYPQNPNQWDPKHGWDDVLKGPDPSEED